MAEDVVGIVIFHNPVITNIDKVNVDLATRRVLVKQNDTELNRRFKTLGIYICEDPNHNDGIWMGAYLQILICIEPL